jgi:hypothetical protein
VLLLEEGDTETILAAMLGRLRFQFDPFAHLEASADPRLTSYLVAHPDVGALENNQPAVIFAPPGGGKTALRMGAVNEIWTGYGTEHTFPIPFILSKRTPSAEQLIEISRAAARVLLIALAAQPELLASVSTSGKQQLVNVLAAALPQSLGHYARWLAQKPALSQIVRRLNFRYLLPARSSLPNLEIVVKLFSDTVPAPVAQGDLFRAVQYLLLDVLKFSSITLHLDGVDGDATATPDASAMWDIIEWAITQAVTWQQQQTILHAFLPEELAPYLRHASLRQIHIHWNAELLAAVLRRRIYQATGGEYGSFDAFAARGLRNIEMLLAAAVPLLPREIILLAHLVVQRYAYVARENDTLLTSSIIDDAITAYQLQSHHLRYHPTRALLQTGASP